MVSVKRAGHALNLVLTTMQPIAPGQFDDAEEETKATDLVSDIRAAYSYIDNSESEDPNLYLEDDDDSELYFSDEDIRVEDEDWEKAEKGTLHFLHPTYRLMHPDFTKQFNRLRQHVAVHSGMAEGTKSSINKSNKIAVLPAFNKPRTGKRDTEEPAQTDKTMDQFTALLKYSSRISKIDIPYTMGVGVNRKGPSAYANAKDKSDRATNEQVLDPRTRLILFKMIGRGLIHEVNGCVSTGKEVRRTSYPQLLYSSRSGQRVSRFNTRLQASCA